MCPILAMGSHRIIKYPELEGPYKDQLRTTPGPAQDT